MMSKYDDNVDVFKLPELQPILTLKKRGYLLSDKPLNNPAAVVDVMREFLAWDGRECCCVVHLDTNLRPISYEKISIGGLTQCPVSIPNVFKSAIMHNANSIMLFHNHPSGVPDPSIEDVKLTQTIAIDGKLLGIPVVDHVIIGSQTEKIYSFAEKNSELFENPQKFAGENILDLTHELCEKKALQNTKTNKAQSSASTQRETDKKLEYRKSVADQFLKLLDKDNPVDAFAWVKQWQNIDMPRSLITDKEYSGTNSYLLKMVQIDRGYNDPRWITFLGCKQFKGAHVKRGERATKIQRWLVRDKTKRYDEKGATIDFSEMNRLIKDGRDKNDFAIFPKYYTVFNAEQCEGLPPLENELHNDIKQDDYVSKVVESMNVPIYNNGGDNAYYRPDEDAVHLPQKEVFKSSYAYNATALHELAHASGADTRLQRSGINDCNCFDDKQYGYEELIAEMTACFAAANLMSDETGMDEYIAAHAENHYKYVKSWAESIRADPNILIDAMDEAQLAADFLDVHGGVMDIADFNKKNYDWKIAKDDFGDVILQSKNKAVESFDICDNVNVITQTKERHR